MFAVVIFFWMAFHQNGQSLTWFARDYTQSFATGVTRIGFNIWALALIAASVYTLFGIFQSEKATSKVICGAVTAALWGGVYSIYQGQANPLEIFPQEFQQFNPFFVVALTPVSMAIFSALASRKDARHPAGREPSAPVKIGLGMFVAALGYLVMVYASRGQASPAELAGTVSPDPVVPTYLIGTYLILTFAELLLSPMGISPELHPRPAVGAGSALGQLGHPDGSLRHRRRHYVRDDEENQRGHGRITYTESIRPCPACTSYPAATAPGRRRRPTRCSRSCWIAASS